MVAAVEQRTASAAVSERLECDAEARKGGPRMVPSPDGQDGAIVPMLELSLPPTVAGPAAARSGLLAWLGHGAYADAETEILELLVSELVTNSVRHAQITPDDLLRLTASVSAGTLRIAVHAHGVEGSSARREGHRLDGRGGYGLDLIAKLSTGARQGVSRGRLTRALRSARVRHDHRASAAARTAW